MEKFKDASMTCHHQRVPSNRSLKVLYELQIHRDNSRIVKKQ